MLCGLMQRPDWDTYFMDIARVVASRGNCRRRQVAAYRPEAACPP